jgi:hypothetical protein
MSGRYKCIDVKCPYCGYNNRIWCDLLDYGPQVVTCDCDDGPGCGRYFAFSTVWAAKVQTYALTEVTDE